MKRFALVAFLVTLVGCETVEPMERLMEEGLVQRISGDTVYVSRPAWIGLSREGKRTFTRYAAEYTPNEGVLVVDGVSGRSLAEVSEGRFRRY